MKFAHGGLHICMHIRTQMCTYLRIFALRLRHEDFSKKHQNIRKYTGEQKSVFKYGNGFTKKVFIIPKLHRAELRKII